MSKAGVGQPQVVYGEFSVTEVKEVVTNEYNRLATQRLIHSPSNTKTWREEMEQQRIERVVKVP